MTGETTMPPWPLRVCIRSFPRWVRDRYPTAVGSLEDLGDSSDEFWLYAWRCIESAEYARAWTKANAAGLVDPYEAGRRDDMAYLEATQRVATTAKFLADHIDRYPRKSAFALASALLVLKEQDGRIPLQTLTSDPEGVNPFGHGPGTVPHVVARLLRAYAAVIAERPLAKAGPFQHRFYCGALLLDRAIDQRSARPDIWVTSLIFALVLFARFYTARRPYVLCDGLRIPEEGRPLWSVAASFLGDALDVQLSVSATRDRLEKFRQRNPGVSWGHWPPPPAGYLDTPDRDTWA